MQNQNEKKLPLNRGEELILRRNRKIKKEEEPKSFSLSLTKILPWFKKEIHLRFEVIVKPKQK